MVVKITKHGWCSLVMAYWVEYIDEKCGNTITYFEYKYERNNFIKEHE